MPFGADLDKIDVDQEIILTPEQKSFCEEYGLPEYELELCYKIPCFISSSYTCNSLRDMLYLEFTKILEAGLEFQQCRRCGKYFIVKGNYHGAYCDRIADGEHRTCQQLAAQEAYLEKLKDNAEGILCASTRNTTSATLPESRAGLSNGINSNCGSMRLSRNEMIA